jgi:hypothetical protein
MQAKAHRVSANVFRPGRGGLVSLGLAGELPGRLAHAAAHKKAPKAKVTPLSLNGDRTKL